jgi:hypothetical protein
VNIRFEAFLRPTARWVLDRLRVVAPAEYAQIVQCIAQLEHNPYPPPSLRAPLVIPGQRVYPEAYRCRAWRIAFRVEADTFVVIEDIRRWPPRPF